MTDDRRFKLQPFNKLYYGDDLSDKAKSHFKYKQLPNAMLSYGHNLKKELTGNLPKYYRVYRPGTLVMLDLGVRVGSEISGPHWGVVLSKKDTKYKATITVVPLSSKYHKQYVPLGKQLFHSASKLIDKHIENINNNIYMLEQHLDAVKDKFGHIKFDFEFSDDEGELMDNISNLLGEFDYKLTFDLRVDFVDPKLTKIIDRISEIPNIDNNSSVKQFLSNLMILSAEAKNLCIEYKEARDELDKILKLETQIEKLNRETYADVSNIVTVSKLRAFKTSNYCLSENIKLPDASVKIVREKLFNLI